MVNMTKCTSKGVEAESWTDTTKLPVYLEHFNRDGKGWFLRWGAEEAVTDKAFIREWGLGNVAEFLTTVIWWTMSKTKPLTDRNQHAWKREGLNFPRCFYPHLRWIKRLACFPLEILLREGRNLELPCINTLLNQILASTGVDTFSIRWNQPKIMEKG